MNKQLNWHHIKVMIMWFVVFCIGGLQALKGSVPGDVTSLIGLLGFVEHILSGNSTLMIPTE